MYRHRAPPGGGCQEDRHRARQASFNVQTPAGPKRARPRASPSSAPGYVMHLTGNNARAIVDDPAGRSPSAAPGAVGLWVAGLDRGSMRRTRGRRSRRLLASRWVEAILGGRRRSVRVSAHAPCHTSGVTGAGHDARTIWRGRRTTRRTCAGKLPHRAPRTGIRGRSRGTGATPPEPRLV